jgi:hypothetical protein
MTHLPSSIPLLEADSKRKVYSKQKSSLLQSQRLSFAVRSSPEDPLPCSSLRFPPNAILLLEDALSIESAAANWLPRAASTNSSRKGPPNAMRAIELLSLMKVLIKA